MEQPLITIYRPEQKGNQWIARADVNLHGDTIELRATASDRLAKRARDWYSRASNWVSKWVELKGFKRPDKAQIGKGVFCDVPAIAHELGKPEHRVHDSDVDHAATLYQGCLQGRREALEQLECIVMSAPYDPLAAEAADHIRLVQTALHERASLPIQAIMGDAIAGVPHARKLLAALHATAVHDAPVRLTWSQDDYLNDRESLASDLKAATVGQRLLSPPTSRGGRYQRVRPALARRAQAELLQMPMLRTFQQMDQAYTL